MTTIAFKDGVMACDSKCTDDDGAFFSRTQKIFRLANNALLGTAGDGDVREVIDVFDTCAPKRLPSKQKLADTKTDFAGLLAFPGGRLFGVDIQHCKNRSEWTAQVVEIEERIAACGSGHQFAIGAMAAGRSAAEAVAIACRYDSYSQGPIKEISVKVTKRK